MRTNYEAHDIPYRRKKAAGWPGWNSAEEVHDCIQTLNGLLEPLEVASTADVCEIGCGAGNLTDTLADRGWSVTGVDVSNVAIHWARERCRQQNVTFLRGNICERELFAAASFDLIIDGLCLHCIIGEDRDRVISNLSYWLKPGGRIVVFTMCGEPKGKDRAGYDPKSRCAYSGDIAVRYFAEAEEIIDDFRKESLPCTFQQVVDPPNEQASLRALFEKPR
ncbi:bifunctional 3-demethylubiquinone-9 3-methyltransferase/ 2-octaprenyl-6-hydroxy phenol methylase [Symmachiella dynata]|uniref:class I SAM-dependent methyltransferase n=1 Tax=Symmachiella dynata TaxID=2527995 RepID=UPI0011898D4E|nr:class I SAM-dependent methyltransferase [Symmachiella dynata]QDT48186.1 bifunctional 3-demethylubiquinone-9 3-methyltransferase/ 2-octaprenyl-6-hydroxy phenol methylase [Symmachiella dynata]